MKRTRLLALLAAPLFAGLAGTASAEGVRERTEPWPEETLAVAERIPVQEGGRIKPLGTMASFLMLRLNGKRSFETEWGEELTPTAWLLDCLFFPDQATDYRIVRVEDYRVLESVGLERRGAKRSDRYSLRELEPGYERLRDQGRNFAQQEGGPQGPLESQIVNLSRVLPELLLVTSTLEFAGARHAVAGVPELEVLFPEQPEITNVQFLERLDDLRANLDRGQIPASEGLSRVLADMDASVRFSYYVSCLPPSDPAEETYLSPYDALVRPLQLGIADGAQLAILRRFEELHDQRGDMAALSAGIEDLQAELAARADARGEYAKVDQEVGFYERDWFTRSQYGFLLAFLCSLAVLLRPSSRWLYRGAWALAVLGELALVGGIVERCILRGRPPVTTPYEAILFIVSVGVLVMFFVEGTRRTALPLLIAAVTGALGMQLANWNETTEGTDTMQPLVAVLDSNFWLSVHVTTVTLGYCAGWLAALIAHLYIFGKLFGLKRGDRKWYGDLSRMIYGVLCFGLLFSTVGTILGGVWANDSWGRFWGWDPKENGALMLCLGYLVVLHARMGGYIREHGIALASVAIGIIVMWAFWGVNLIGVGLHSYGFTETKMKATQVFYWTEGGVLALGMLAWTLERARQRKPLLG